jgi:tetratricopeptide (TPR) repeat protein
VGGADGYDLRMRLAAASIHAGDADRALAELARAATFDPQRAEPHLERAELYSKRHDEAARIAELEQVAALDPNAKPALTELVRAYSERADWPKLARYAARAVEVDPFDAKTLEALAKAREALGQRREAAAARQAAELARGARQSTDGEDAVTPR